MPPYTPPRCLRLKSPIKHKYRKSAWDNKPECIYCGRSKEYIEHKHIFKLVKACRCGKIKI